MHLHTNNFSIMKHYLFNTSSTTAHLQCEALILVRLKRTLDHGSTACTSNVVFHGSQRSTHSNDISCFVLINMIHSKLRYHESNIWENHITDPLERGMAFFVTNYSVFNSLHNTSRSQTSTTKDFSSFNMRLEKIITQHKVVFVLIMYSN